LEECDILSTWLNFSLWFLGICIDVLNACPMIAVGLFCWHLPFLRKEQAIHNRQPGLSGYINTIQLNDWSIDDN
jgi:chloramphenicol 3-O-phosphotransferase